MSAMKGLGRGFSSLIPTDGFSEFDPTKDEDIKESKLIEIPIEDIVPDESQPRKNFDENALNALAASIKEHGVLQPIVVTKEGGKYKIVAGERRWRASNIAKIKTMPAIVRTLDSQNRLEISLIENLQREDLNAIETATAYDKLKEQFNMTDAEIGKRLGRSASAIVNTCRLLKLPDEAKRAMIEYDLKEGQMRPLISATPEQISQVLPKIIEEGWSARKVEQYMVELRKTNKENSQPKEESEKIDQHLIEREERMSQHLGMTCKVHTSTRGSGNIVVKFKNKEEFERLCTILTMSK